MRTIRCILTVILLSTLLTGCWGTREIDHMIYVNTLGVDYVKDKVVVYIQMVNFGGIAKKESGQSQQQKTYVGKAEGDAFDAAVFNLYESSPQRIVWSNVKSVVFTENALKHGLIDQVFDVWDRYYEFRYTVWAMATREPLERVLNATSTSELSAIYSQLNSPMRSYEQSSIVAPLYMYKFIWKWKEKGETVQLPYLETVSGWTDNQKQSPNNSMAGVCFLDHQKFRSCLPAQDILGLRWTEKKTIRTPLIIKEKKKIKAVIVMNNIKSSIRPRTVNGKPVFDIKVSMQGTLPQLSTSLHRQQLELQAAKEVKSQIMDTYVKGLEKDIDVYSLSAKLYRSMPKEWQELSAKGQLKLDRGSIGIITVKVNLISGGISKMR
ncbi:MULTISPECIES: Ger(x)C family spore germination protein [Paenibacillus]|uniref:Ger(x)C family spore germination protein n=1 Tax=Paenibacillus TaxID=44249 RepID=UPI001643C602|nr:MULTISPECIES: Ger(x)C family spore germination protein [Paenibacillus]MBJ9990905.1 Ger(x)C family spore germination protein [Paenibacillus sp. S28]